MYTIDYTFAWRTYRILLSWGPLYVRKVSMPKKVFLKYSFLNGEKKQIKINFYQKKHFPIFQKTFFFYQNIFGKKNFETSVNQVFMNGKKYYRKYR